MPRCSRSSPSGRRSRSSTATTRRAAGPRVGWTGCGSSSTRRASPSSTPSSIAKSTPSRDRSRISLMSPDDPTKKGQEFFGMFQKAKEFTEELLKENERLRFKIAHLEAEGGSAPPSADAAVQDLIRRIHEL